MEQRAFDAADVRRFEQYLLEEECCQSTIEKYLRDVRAFAVWLDSQSVTKESVRSWKEYLVQKGYAPATINSMLSALNTFLRFQGWQECCVKFLKIQRRMFRDSSRELTREEYLRLINTARALAQERLALMIETIGATGIRVSEVRYITVEAVQSGKVSIMLKGKIRTILLSQKLCRKLQKYAKQQKIASGEIFLTRSGSGISRKQIWADMKRLCKKAGVSSKKVFPHNLRHLFARMFYHVSRDIAKLADVLGHSSIETTRIYLLSAGTEHIRHLERLGLIC